MSILNAFVSPRRAIVAVDTECSMPGGGFGVASKIFPLVHSNALLAFRGPYVFGLTAFAVSAAAGGSFDDLVEAFPCLIEAAYCSAKAEAAKLSNLALFEDGLVEVLLVGFSVKRDRLFGAHCVRRTSESSFSTTLDVGTFVSPFWDDAGLPRMCPSDPNEIVAIMHQQAALVRDRCPGGAAGGRIVIAELSSNEVSISSLGTFVPRR